MSTPYKGPTYNNVMYKKCINAFIALSKSPACWMEGRFVPDGSLDGCRLVGACRIAAVWLRRLANVGWLPASWVDAGRLDVGRVLAAWLDG